ncbi:hypothetical protein SAMN04487967_1632 [Natronorubrum sediminis]|uniref:Uncharacterized protein n=1 Tax=Natronorubrum sediminis TaxID=640943 RepID=A0A1H6FVP2_9EURY|nr:hypothetical protein [Natronorubrum sediminis]SEH14502.1 hypothetical protein SAMN04487967_1632 [Natronorubrum sediminis]
MVDDDLELERDLGEATIVYDEPDEGTVNKTVPNEHIAYFQDHWIIKTDEDEEGHDIVRRIPAQRVHYVERSVEQFEEEVQTVVDQVQSFAADLRTKIPVGGGNSGEKERPEPHRISIDRDEDGDSSR